MRETKTFLKELKHGECMKEQVFINRSTGLIVFRTKSFDRALAAWGDMRANRNLSWYEMPNEREHKR